MEPCPAERTTATRLSCGRGQSRSVYETIAQTGQRHGAIARVAKQLGIGRESVSHWVNRKEVDEAKRPGRSTDDMQRLLELERENVELRRANEILKAAAGFFASLCNHSCASGGLARFFAAQLRLWLVPDPPLTGHAGPFGVT